MNEFKCACGRVYKLQDGGHTYKSSYRNNLTAATPVTSEAPARPRKTAREQEFEVPAVISLFTGGIVAAIAMLLKIVPRIALAIGLGATLLVWILAIIIWLLYRYELMRQLTWAAEDALGVDLDGDDEAGEPGEGGGVLIINGAPKRPRQWDRISAAYKQRDLEAFALKVYELNQAGVGAGQKALRGWGLPSRFKCNDRVHGILSEYLVGARLAYRDSSGLKFYAEIESEDDLVDRLREKCKVGEQ